MNDSILTATWCAAQPLLPSPGATGAIGAASGTTPAAPGVIQLFPLGRFAATDGRPATLQGVGAAAWSLDAGQAAALVARWQTRRTPVVIDYEHQTELAETNGQPAPAAGWIVALHCREDGLFADVEWTPRAREYIRAGEYRFISPSFKFDPKTGAVIQLISAALTNLPALDGMESVRARQIKGETMNRELLARLRKALGLPDTADEAQCMEALAGLPDGNLVALLRQKDAEIASLTVESKPGANTVPDPAQYVPVAMFHATSQQVAALAAEVASLKTKADGDALETEIQAALKDGRLHAVGEEWARQLAVTNPDALKAYLKTAPSIAALTGRQTNGNTPPDKAGVASLTAEEQLVCVQLGMKPEDFAQAKEAR